MAFLNAKLNTMKNKEISGGWLSEQRRFAQKCRVRIVFQPDIPPLSPNFEANDKGAPSDAP
jgi:hypothetical protein